MMKYMLCTGIGMSLAFYSVLAQVSRPAQYHSQSYIHPIITAPGSIEITNPEILSPGSDKPSHRTFTGIWKNWHKDDVLADSGRLKRGIPDGEWKHWNEDGVLVAVRNYDSDKLKRVLNEIAVNHPKAAVYPLTRIYRKNHRLGENHMRPQEISNRDANTHSVFTSCLHHGLFINFYVDGSVKDFGSYKNGLREGIWIYRNPDNSYLRGVYYHGLRKGDWRLYDGNNRIRQIIIYKSGREVSRKDIGRRENE
jgi:antitoxin component YwqK of YwqJK toxin-antitoxin module